VVNVVMPQFGETVAEGELTRWLVSVGDSVAIDEPIAEISTDKVDTEVVASSAGIVSALLVEVGTIVEVGAPLLELDGTGETAATTATPVAHADPAAVVRTPHVSASTGRPRTTPKARRVAKELGVDIATVSTGKTVVHAGDVLAAVVSSSTATAASVEAPTPGQYLLQHSRIRRITAQRTRESLSVAATAWSVTEVDYGNVDLSRKALSAAWKGRYGSSLTYLPYVLRAVSLALVQFPRLNAEYRDDGLLVSESVNIGVAVDLGDGGLSVPVLRDAARFSVADAAVELNRIAGAARSGTLGADDYAGSTFAVTNNGSYGSVLTMPVINQPNVGILSFDAVTLQPSVVTLGDGSYGIAVRPKGALALSWDHRAIDGAYAAKFLTAVKALLETTAWDVSLPV
jgi:pyruvate dehydrogenase E2 component (dihydrolipoamide acetyltransferase)